MMCAGFWKLKFDHLGQRVSIMETFGNEIHPTSANISGD
jgi:hypothetical protein